jgi:uncharacterized metal-binding protein YceD (DUF177 family)
MLGLDVHHLLSEPTGTSLELPIEEGERPLAADLTVAFLRGVVQLLRTDYGLFVEGEIATQVEIQCARCLTPIACSLTVHLSDHFAYRPQAIEQDEDPVYPIFGKGAVDLAPPLREHILLGLPVHPLCGPDCRGLCSQCGANLNETQCDCSQGEADPRLAVLKTLL